MKKALLPCIFLFVAYLPSGFAQNSGIDQYYEDGKAMLKSGDFSGSKNKFDKGLRLCSDLNTESSTNCVLMLFNRAVANRNLDLNRAAERDLSTYFEYKTDDAGDYDFFGEIKYSLKDYLGAVEAFTTSINKMGRIETPYIGRAKSYLELRRLEEANKDIDTYLSAFPSDYEANLIKGYIEFWDANYGTARKFYTKAYSINPNSLEAINNIANTYKEEGNCEKALEYYTQLVEMNKNIPYGFCNRALCYIKYQEFGKAEADLEEAKRTGKDLDKIYYILGKLHFIRGAYKEALKMYEEALIYKPEMLEALSGKAEAYQKMGDFDSAMRTIKQVMEKDDQNPVYKCQLAHLKIEGNDVDGGITLLNNILQIAPKYSKALAYRGYGHFRNGDDHLAKADFEAALKSNRFNVFASYQSAVLLKSTNTKEALKRLNNAIEQEPNYVDARELKAEINIFLGGKIVDIIREFEHIVAIQPFNHHAYYQKGLCYLKLGDTANALDAFNRAASHGNDTNSNYYIEIGETLLRLVEEKGQSDDVEEDRRNAKLAFDHALLINANADRAYKGRGLAQLGLGNTEAALKDFEKGAALIAYEGDRQDFYYLQGKVYYQKGDYEGALTLFEKAKNISPDYINNRYLLGLTYLAIGEHLNKDALVQFNHAIELTNLHEAHPFRADLHMQRGILYNNNKEFKEAIADFNVSISLDAKNIVYLENRGLAYEANGDFSLALSDFTKVVRMDKDNFRIHFYKGKIHNRLTQYMAAVVSISEAIKYDQNATAEYHHERGIAYFNMKKEAKAVTDFMKAVDLDASFYKSYAYLGKIYSGQKNLAKAVGFYTKAIEGSPENPTLRKERGDAYYGMKDYSAARADFKNAIVLKLSDGKEITLLRKGHCNRHLNEEKVAMNDFETVLAMNGNFKGEAYHGQGLLYYTRGKLEKAISSYNLAEPLVQENFEKSILLFNRGAAYRKKGMQMEACRDYTASAALGFKDAKEAATNYCK